jgi:hypothetical protein
VAGEVIRHWRGRSTSVLRTGISPDSIPTGQGR